MRKTIQVLAVVVASLSLTVGAGSAAAVAPDDLPAAGKPDNPGSKGKGKGKEKSNAARACKAERADIGVDAFRDKYGTNENGKNAFGKCVSSQRKQKEGSETE